MRSSKSRSRSKANRPRTLGNIVNRVFDSSGPEGKVRGTRQQIIEKYSILARDAQLSNDRVAAENFLQHAEHYTRMLAEAQREMAAEQEQRRQYHEQRNGEARERHDRYDDQRRDMPLESEDEAVEVEVVVERCEEDVATPVAEPMPVQVSGGLEIIELDDNIEVSSELSVSDEPAAPARDKPRPPRRPRGPRKPRATEAAAE